MNMPDDEFVARFHRDGFVRCGTAIAGEALAVLRAEIAVVISNLPASNRPENMRNPHERCPAFLALCLDGPIVDAAERLLGARDLLMWGTYGFAKPARDGLPVDWHQDGRYFPLAPMETVTAWLALDDASEENGCLRMIPGSHRARRFLPHVMRSNWGRDTALPLAVEQADAARAVPLEVPAGHFEIHDPYTVHGSGPNLSDRPRWGIQILYATRRAKLDIADQQVMGLDWSTLRLFHCRTRGLYHLASAPERVLAFGAPSEARPA